MVPGLRVGGNGEAMSKGGRVLVSRDKQSCVEDMEGGKGRATLQMYLSLLNPTPSNSKEGKFYAKSYCLQT